MGKKEAAEFFFYQNLWNGTAILVHSHLFFCHLPFCSFIFRLGEKSTKKKRTIVLPLRLRVTCICLIYANNEYATGFFILLHLIRIIFCILFVSRYNKHNKKTGYIESIWYILCFGLTKKVVSLFSIQRRQLIPENWKKENEIYLESNGINR